ncbi:MAG: hypothetical protein GC180_07240 [Bacteroidetes bacterium]|nr:hypothetical protein [Bacteroidota bacterium]
MLWKRQKITSGSCAMYCAATRNTDNYSIFISQLYIREKANIAWCPHQVTQRLFETKDQKTPEWLSIESLLPIVIYITLIHLLSGELSSGFRKECT